MLYLQHAPVRTSLHLLAVPALRTCHRPLCTCRLFLATQAIRPVTRLRPPAPPPPCSACHPHSHHLFSRACRMLCLQHAPVHPSLHLLAVPALRTCHSPLRPCRLSLSTQAIRPVTRLRPPAPPPPCSARHPHSHCLFSRACRMLCLQHAPIRLSLHLLAVPALRTCHRPSRPCRLSLAPQAIRPVMRLLPPAPPPPCSAHHPHSHRLFSRACRMLCLQNAPVRPSLHLLAVPALRTCHRPLRPCRPSLATQATRPVTRLRPPAPPPSYSARHPHLHRSLSHVCDPQHVPARPPLYLLAVPVTRTCTVLLAMSAILSTRPLARPSTSSPWPSPALAPLS